MINRILANLYVGDLRTLVDEVNQFKSEDNLWKTVGNVKNPSGNLVLHITGGLNHFIGATLGNTGYIRDRNLEFSRKDVKREELVAGLEEVIILVGKTLNSLPPEKMEAEFPLIFDNEKRSTTFVLVRLLAHLDYHLGQVNYLRRILE